MKLLQIEEIKAGLDQEFLALEPMLLGYRLIPHSLSVEVVASCEQRLGVVFPSSFVEILAAYDFGNLTIGPVVFGNASDYVSKLIELNESIRWWGDGSRPSNIVMIANSDPFAILLDTSSGGILAMDAALGWKKSLNIASNFELFFRGLGTVMLRRMSAADRTSLGNDICGEVGGLDCVYWQNLAS